MNYVMGYIFITQTDRQTESFHDLTLTKKQLKIQKCTFDSILSMEYGIQLCDQSPLKSRTTFIGYCLSSGLESIRQLPQ